MRMMSTRLSLVGLAAGLALAGAGVSAHSARAAQLGGQSADEQAPAPGAQDTQPDEGTGLVAHAGIEGSDQGGGEEAAPPPPINWYHWHKGKNIHGGPLKPGEEPMPPGYLFALLNFAVFLVLLVKFAGPKTVAYLRSRHDLVRNQLEEAARLRREAEDKLAQYEKRIASVDAEVASLMAEIRAESEAEREQILAQAKAQAKALETEAARRVDSEIARARLLLEQEVLTAAVAAAEKVLRERTEPADQARLFDDFVATLTPRTDPPPRGRRDTSDIDKEWS